jgi:serine/threonine protein kinase
MTMSFLREANAEPIPGYRLIEPLGSGGFGEAWKCEAPGGLFKAIKFVYGELESSTAGDDDPSRAEQELKALSRVKTVHHPYILSLERYDIIDNQLIIVMELADRTLWDRFRECRSQGLPGIPREELLKYMMETAEALDLMNNQFQLQHLDIKPQNLFLVFNHVKVADFGLVKDLGAKGAATVTGGVTPVYAAPETFDGWLSRFSDQYSLAIVFQELLTGQRPFSGGTMRQLVMQHIQGNPDLAPLPLADRPVVGRALSKNPDERYPCCVDLITQLRSGSPPPTPPVPAAPAPPLISNLVPDVALPECGPVGPSSLSTEETLGARGHRSGPVKASTPDEATGQDQDYHFLDRPQILPPRPDRKATGGTEPGAVAGPEARAADATGVLQPALVIGLGKLGLETLGQFRARLNAEFGSPEAVPQLRLFGIDTDPTALQEAGAAAGETGLRGHESLLARLHRPSHYIKKNTTEQWLNPKLIYRIPREQNSAGVRALGRLAFVDNFRVVYRRLEAELEAFNAPDTPVEADKQTELGVRSYVPRVYIVTCLAGNTGSGMFLDIAYVTRHLLRKLGLGAAEIIGLFYLPPVRDVPGQNTAGLANTYAALTELGHFARGTGAFVARYSLGDERERVDVHEDGAPFQRCFLLNLPEPRAGLAAVDNRGLIALAGDFLYHELATPLGRSLDGERLAQQGSGRQPMCLQSFGMYRLTWPRPAFLEGCGRRLCVRLVARWMSKDAKPVAACVQQWANEKIEALQLRPEHLIGRMHEWTEKAVKQPIEHFFATLSVGPGVGGPASAKPNKDEAPSLASLLQLAQRLDGLLGVPDECRPPNQSGEAGTIERLLANGAAKLGDQMEQKLAELAVVLIEDPNYRLAGAEEALRQFTANIEQALQAQESLAKELHERAVQLYHNIQRFPEGTFSQASPAASLWKPSFIRRGAPATAGPSPVDNLTDLLRNYAKARYHSLVLAQINRFYVALRGQLSDQLREVGFCRQRLSELSGLVQPQPAPETRAAHMPQVRQLLPAACLNLEDAIEQADRDLTPADVIEFDRHAQDAIEQHYRALVQVCMGASSTVHKLAPQLIRLAERFLEGRFESSSVAEMYFAHLESTCPSGTREAAGAEMWSFYDKAAPHIGSKRGATGLALVSLPDDPRGREIRGLIESNLPNVSVFPSNRTDEILFYREHLQLALTDLEQAGKAGQAAYRQRCAQDPSALHCREDIIGWQPLAAGSVS